MSTHPTPPTTVRIGRRNVSLLIAALIAQESDRLGILPCKVGNVVLPQPEPTHVMIAGFRLSITTSAYIAEEADAQRMHPKKLLEAVLMDCTAALGRRARTRETRPTLAGCWVVRSNRSKGNRGDA